MQKHFVGPQMLDSASNNGKYNKIIIRCICNERLLQQQQQNVSHE